MPPIEYGTDSAVVVDPVRAMVKLAGSAGRDRDRWLGYDVAGSSDQGHDHRLVAFLRGIVGGLDDDDRGCAARSEGHGGGDRLVIAACGRRATKAQRDILRQRDIASAVDGERREIPGLGGLGIARGDRHDRPRFIEDRDGRAGRSVHRRATGDRHDRGLSRLGDPVDQRTQWKVDRAGANGYGHGCGQSDVIASSGRGPANGERDGDRGGGAASASQDERGSATGFRDRLRAGRDRHRRSIIIHDSRDMLAHRSQRRANGRIERDHDRLIAFGEGVVTQREGDRLRRAASGERQRSGAQRIIIAPADRRAAGDRVVDRRSGRTRGTAEIHADDAKARCFIDARCRVAERHRGNDRLRRGHGDGGRLRRAGVEAAVGGAAGILRADGDQRGARGSRGVGQGAVRCDGGRGREILGMIAGDEEGHGLSGLVGGTGSDRRRPGADRLRTGVSGRRLIRSLGERWRITAVQLTK